MKYVKMLGLLAVAAAALMAFAGTASATTLTSPKGTTYTGVIKAETENGHAILHNAITTVECTGTVEGSVEKHGAGVTVEGKISSLTFTNCTGSNTVHDPVAKPGSLVVHAINCNASNECTGTVTSVGAEVVITNHAFGGSCIYTTGAGVDIGTLTPTNDTGGTATLDIEGTIPRTGGTLGAFCGSTGTWTGNYLITTPDSLYVNP